MAKTKYVYVICTLDFRSFVHYELGAWRTFEEAQKVLTAQFGEADKDGRQKGKHRKVQEIQLH